MGKKLVNFRVVVVDGKFTNNLLSRSVSSNLGLIKLMGCHEVSTGSESVPSLYHDDNGELELDSSLYGDLGLWENTDPVKITLKDDYVPYVATAALPDASLFLGSLK